MKKRVTRYFQHHPVISSIAAAFIFGFLQLSFSYCSKVNCPAFADTKFDEWFPYKTDQRIIFSNGLLEKDTITIATVFKSPASTSSGGYGSSSYCSASVNINSKETLNGQQYKFSLYGDVFESGKNFQLSIYDFRIYNLQPSDSGLVVNSANNGNNSGFAFEYLLNTNFNNKVYSKLEIITADTNQVKSNRIYKIWLASKEGVIAYEEYPSKNRWIKQ